MGVDIDGESIVNSEAVIGVFAACEWDEISEDGHVWIDAIIQETVRRVAPLPPAASSNEAAIDRDDTAALVEAFRDDPFFDDYQMLGTTGHDQRLNHYAMIALANRTPPQPASDEVTK